MLAAKLGKIIGCPVLHLDKLQFEAGWKERGEAEGKMLCEQFLEENKDRGWVIDGNYEKFCQKKAYERSRPDHFYGLSKMDLPVAGVAPLLQIQRPYQKKHGRWLCRKDG